MAGPGSVALAVPAYNAAWCIPRLLQSAHAQVVPFDEILVYDDCSSDGTSDIAHSMGATVLQGNVNSGCSAAKNRLLEAANSEWIHFHDADDELLPNFTTLARNWMASKDAPDVVLFDYEYRDNDSKQLLARISFSDEMLISDPVRYAIIQQINPFCGLYRAARLKEVGGYDVDAAILYNEDVAFHCKLALNGFSFRAEKEVSIINYRVSNSMSGSHEVNCLRAHQEVMRRMSEAVGPKYPEEIAERLWYIATNYAVRGMWQDADRVLEDAAIIFNGVPRGQSPSFRIVCQMFGAAKAFRIREWMVRQRKALGVRFNLWDRRR